MMRLIILKDTIPCDVCHERVGGIVVNEKELYCSYCYHKYILEESYPDYEEYETVGIMEKII